jgi:hypothetical protein
MFMKNERIDGALASPVIAKELACAQRFPLQIGTPSVIATQAPVQ